jgi:uncharacterized membrane protein
MRKLITRLLEPKEHAPEAAYLLTQLMGAKISRSTLDKDIKGHPNYPTFLSISDVLNNYGVENLTARFDKNKLSEIPTPFITQVSGKKHITQFTVVNEINDKRASYFDPETQGWSTITLEAFAEQSTGTVLMAEIEEQVQEKDYEKKLAEERRIKFSQTLLIACLPLVLLFSVMLSLFNTGSAAILPSLYAMLALAGVGITVLLLWYEIDQNNAALQDICTGGKKINCSAILQSKEAKIFGISWSSLGFVYFAGSLTLLLLSGLTNSITLNMLSWLTLGVTPYVFYSIYYQWRVAKQWCVLCLSVQLVLTLQCVLTFIARWRDIVLLQNSNLAGSLLAAAAAFTTPFIVVRLLIPALRKAKENSQLTQELQRLKHSEEIFTAVLEKQKAIEHSTEGLGITMGNPNAKIKLVKVCNPYCGPCARAHTPVEELLHNNPNLQVQMIFTAADDDHDIRAQPVRHLLAIDQKQDATLTEQALDDWYLAEKKDYDAFAQKYPLNGELKKQGEKIKAMRDWCDKTDIQFTPTFFLNGYQLPSNYTVNDLKYFLLV